MSRAVTFFILLLLTHCDAGSAKVRTEAIHPTAVNTKPDTVVAFDTATKTIHVLVALCDNKYQGIVPVPAGIGNGQNPATNLYWGCGYGVRSFFKNSKDWHLIRTQKPDSIRLERLIFKHAAKNIYLVADAYDGRFIKQCTKDLLLSCAGGLKDTVQVGKTVIGTGGNASLIAYIGHDGLMDFNLAETFSNKDGRKRDCIILACASKAYFAPHLKVTGANPLVWTTGLMCPEAYTLHDALTAYVNGEGVEGVRSNAAKAYAKYQKCSEKAARNLLVAGW